MLSDLVFSVAVVWITALAVGSVVLVLRARTVPGRILALDSLVLMVVVLLVLYAAQQGEDYYLDAALVLALVSFVATVAAAQFHLEGSPFR